MILKNIRCVNLNIIIDILQVFFYIFPIYLINITYFCIMYNIIKKSFKLMLFFCVIMTHFSYTADYWQRMSSPTTKWLYKCTFPDSLNGWAAGDSGVIIRTNNAGLSWQVQNSNIPYFIQDIYFLNERLGWAVADKYVNEGSLILYTTNGGQYWNRRDFSDTTLVLFTITFQDSLNGWLAGYGGTFLKTTDAGVSWVRKPTDSSSYSHQNVYNFKFTDKLNGLALGGTRDISGVIWKTSNGGEFWKSQPLGGEPLYDILFLDSINEIAVGGDIEFGASKITTTNGGHDWQYSLFNLFGTGQAVSNRTRSEIWVPLGFSQKFIYSLDSGRTWSDITPFDSSSVYDVTFTDPYHGYAFGTNGLILKYNTSAIGIKSITSSVPKSFSLYQNYPNPFNPTTKIRFNIPANSFSLYEIGAGGFVRLSLYDILGREVSTLVSEQLKPGSYEVEWDASNYPSGIYFYTLETNSFKENKKMVLLK